MQIIAVEVFPPPACEHVEFASFPACDLEYIAPYLETAVDKWREQAEEAEEDFDLVEALCEKRNGSTSFVFAITWDGMPETMWIGFRLGSTTSHGQARDEIAEE